MKVKLTFKTPDVLDQLSDDECSEEMLALLNEYVRYGEYIVVEFDTDLATVEVVSFGPNLGG